MSTEILSSAHMLIFGGQLNAIELENKKVVFSRIVLKLNADLETPPYPLNISRKTIPQL
jgi:hypothetical protein